LPGGELRQRAEAARPSLAGSSAQATIVNVLKGISTPELAPVIASLTIPPDKFSFRWAAE